MGVNAQLRKPALARLAYILSIGLDRRGGGRTDALLSAGECPRRVRRGPSAVSASGPLSPNSDQIADTARLRFRANTGSQADPFDERVGVDKIRNGLASSALGHA